MAIEIERRFLVAGRGGARPDDMPKGGEATEIAQSYLPGTGDWSVRIRRTRRADGRTRYGCAMKRDAGGIAREEIEFEIPKATWREMAASAGPAVLKTRRRVPHGHLCIEVDAYHNPEFEGLVVAEVELPSEDAPFDPPAWLGREITGEKGLTNAGLARSLADEWMARPRMSPEWRRALAPAMATPAATALRAFLRDETVSGARTFPPAERIFAAFAAGGPDDVRVAIIGMDPYIRPGQACGLAFATGPGVEVPPSLANIHRELAADVGAPPPGHGGLGHWTRQGVMLINAVLTVREGQSDSHKGRGWEAITDEAIRILSSREGPIVFVLWGAKAGKKRRLIDETRHRVVASAHPSPLSAHQGFLGSRPFSRTNALLAEAGLPPIDWAIPADHDEAEGGR